MYQSVCQQPLYTHTLQSGGQQLPQLIGLCNTVNLLEPETITTSVSLEGLHTDMSLFVSQCVLQTCIKFILTVRSREDHTTGLIKEGVILQEIKGKYFM